MRLRVIATSWVRHLFVLTGMTLLITGGLTACSPAERIGIPQNVDGGTQILVPALWANDENKVGGIEPATIWVGTNRTSDPQAYDVNLSQVEAKGGGAQWLAATNSAAAIGTLFSGYDANNLTYRFDITDAIDGPSAGGILAVGVLAALNNQPLLEATTMTGTISPDGSIGPVGLIGIKIQAASDAGYQRILLPGAASTISDPENGQPIDAKVYGQSEGVDVVFVNTLMEAYEAFTGVELFPSENAKKFDVSDYPELAQAQARAATNLQQQVSQMINQYPETPSNITSQLDASWAASAEENWSTAFALAVDALDLFSRWQGRVSFEKDMNERGLESAQLSLKTYVENNIDQIDLQLDQELMKVTELSPSQVLALPGALGWLTYSRAVLASMLTDLSGENINIPTAELTDYAGLAHEVSQESAVVFPEVMSVLLSNPSPAVSSPLPSEKPLGAFVSGYTYFLIAAADANLAYLRDVDGVTPTDDPGLDVEELLPVAEELRVEAATIDLETLSLETEIEESATAMTYFVVTTSLVASLQLFGSPDLWLTPEQVSVEGNAYLEESIEQSNSLVHNTADSLLSLDINAGFPVWSAEWGNDAYLALSAEDREATGASIAFNELWYDVITVLSMRAFVTEE